MQEDLIEVERALLRLGSQTDPEAPIPNVCIRCHFKYAVLYICQYLLEFGNLKIKNTIVREYLNHFRHPLTIMLTTRSHESER